MSNFTCQECGTEILDSLTGYTTECELPFSDSNGVEYTLKLIKHINRDIND